MRIRRTSEYYEHCKQVIRVGLPSWPIDQMTRSEIFDAADLIGRLTVNECSLVNVARARQPSAEIKLRDLGRRIHERETTHGTTTV